MQYSVSCVATTALLLSKNGHNQSQSVYFPRDLLRELAPRPPCSSTLAHTCMHIRHPCSHPSKNPGYGPDFVYNAWTVFVYINRLQTWHFILKCKQHTLCYLHISIQLSAHQLSLCVHISIRV